MEVVPESIPIPEIPTIDPKLEQQVAALRALSTTSYLLINGSFQFAQLELMIPCLEFVRNLHSQVMAEALTHPDAQKIEELKNILSLKEKADVKTEES